MNADVAREKLAAALMDARLIRWREPELAREFADALLPVIREIAADELEAAADRVILAETFSEAAQLCRSRADALRSGPPS